MREGHTQSHPTLHQSSSGAFQSPLNVSFGASSSFSVPYDDRPGVFTPSRPRTANTSLRRTLSTSIVRQAVPYKETPSSVLGNAPFGLRKVTAEDMLGEAKIVNGKRTLPVYDPLCDPHMAGFFARKFGWTVQAIPAVSLPRRAPFIRELGELEVQIVFKTGVRSSSPRSTCAKRIVLLGDRLEYGPCELAGPGLHWRPAAEDSFTLQCQDFGVLQSIVVSSDCVERDDAWLLAGVRITIRRRVGPVEHYNFYGERWLRDRINVITMLPGRPTVNLRTETLGGASHGINGYEITVQTGNLKMAGTDAKVFATLHGTLGSTERTLLPQNGRNLFERNAIDHFTLPLPDVGRLTRLTMEHDNSGVAPGWFLERVVVTRTGSSSSSASHQLLELSRPRSTNGHIPSTSATLRRPGSAQSALSTFNRSIKHATDGAQGVAVAFECHMWFSISDGDKKIVRELLPSHGKESGRSCTYIVTTFTADVRYANTEAHISLQMFGPQFDSGTIKLDSTSGVHFRRGKEDSFDVQSRALGALTKIRVTNHNNGHGSSWLLDRVEVLDVSTGIKYPFPCGKWLAVDEGDGLLSRELLVHTGTGTTIPYEIQVATGNKLGASTTAEVFCVLYGSKANSGRVKLENSSNNFKSGRTDTFTVECCELGRLEKILLGHDNTGIGAAWYVEWLSVKCPTMGLLYRVSVQNWFSTNEGDKQLERTLEFTKDGVQKFDEQSVWLCKIHTSDVIFAGTDAKVSMVVYGAAGQHSKDLVLQAKNNIFEKNQHDEFKVTFDTIGQLYKLRVWHDNSGIGAAWHLDCIELIHAQTQVAYRFNCGAWLSLKDKGDVVKEIPASGKLIPKPAKLVQYSVIVTTGKKIGAGTNAVVFINIFGALGDTGKRILRHSNHLDKFEKGQSDEFLLEAVELGKLEKIFVGHDNSGAGSAWFLDQVTVKEVTDKEDCVFPCNRWLATSEDDGLVERYISRANGSKPALATTTYTIRVTTGSLRQAGTNSKVFISLAGDHGTTDKLHLDSSLSFKDKFEKGHIDEFKIEAFDIGEMKSIRIGHDNSGVSAGWFLDQIDIDVSSIGKRFSFPCNRWLCKNEDDGEIERELLTVAGAPLAITLKIPYEITIKTTAVKNAGTDSNIFIAIYGDKGKTDNIYLRSKSDDFESGSTDVFKRELVDVGVPFKIRIGKDNKGLFADWHLESVQLLNINTSTYYTFAGNRWLSKKEGLIVELTLTSGQLLGKDGKRTDIAALTKIQAASQLASYRVIVKTGNLKGAGTDARVGVVLYGDKGDSGDRFLDHSLTHAVNKFERDQTDEFLIEAVDLGRVHRVKVWHDNSGLGPGWYLDNITVRRCDSLADLHHPPLSKQNSTASIGSVASGLSVGTVRNAVGLLVSDWVFPCNLWFDKSSGDHLIMRELGLASHAHSELATSAVIHSYRVFVYTSDIKGAGTDANVELVLYGSLGDSGAIKLLVSENHKDKFERNQFDIFAVSCSNLGPLQKIKIGHDNKYLGAAWHLDRVEVTDNLQGTKWVFPSHQWFDKSEGDGLVERELMPLVDAITHLAAVEAIEKKQPYEVVFLTSNVSGAGTDARIYLVVYGTNGKNKSHPDDVICERVDIPQQSKSAFEKGQEDRFPIQLPEMTSVIKVRVGHDNAGFGAAWHLNKILLINQLTGVGYEFICQNWLSSSHGDKLIERELGLVTVLTADANDISSTKVKRTASQSSLNSLISYKVRVYTGNVSGAGTDANVFINVRGTNGDTGEKKLEHSQEHVNKFEQNQVDTFTLDAINLGDLEEIRVRHDNKGFGAAWYLDRIEVEAPAEKMSSFPCSQWFDKSSGDHLIDRTLAIMLTSAEIESRSLRKKERHELAAVPDVISNNSSRLRAELHPSERHHVDDVMGPIDISDASSTSMTRNPSVNSIKEMINYKVRVYTGNKSGAGTDANISIILRGSDGLTGEKKLENSLERKNNKFNTNQVDTFSIDSINLGDLEDIRVWHDNKGLFAAWYLDRIEVETPNRALSIFPSLQWFDKSSGDHLIDRTLSIALTPEEIASRASLRKEMQHQELVVSAGHASVGRHQSVKNGRHAEDMVPMQHVKYLLAVTTGDVAEASSDAEVWVEIRGRQRRTSSAAKKIPILSAGIGVHDVAPTTDPAKLHNLYYTSTTTGRLRLPHGSNTRGASRTHEIHAADVGEVLQLVIGNDCHNGTGSWFLDRVELTKMNTGSVSTFLCAAWLSDTKAEKITERILQPFVAPVLTATVLHYEVQVVTSDVEHTECALPMTFWMYGSEAPSGELLLDPQGQNWARNEIKTFVLPVSNVGTLTKIRIGYNGAASFAGWPLSRVIIKCLETLVTAEFVYNSWLVMDRGSMSALVELAASSELVTSSASHDVISKSIKLELVTYLVSVLTGTVDGGGTDATVSIIMFGELGDSGEHKLVSSKSHRNPFEKGQMDVFEIRCVDLGHLSKIRIWHNNKKLGASWYLEHIEVSTPERDRRFEFPCKNWLSSDKSDKQLMRELVCAVKDIPLALTQYKITTVTRNVDGAAAPGDVALVLSGSDSTSNEIILHHDGRNFQNGATDTFVFQLQTIGRVNFASVKLVTMGTWLLDQLWVSDVSSGVTQYFVAKTAVTHVLTSLAVVEESAGKSAETAALAEVTYELSVMTSNVTGAGTDANVYVIIYGQVTRDSGERHLKASPAGVKSHSKIFKSNQLDVFHVVCLDLGALSKIKVWHDNKGIGAAWHLDSITVKNLSNNVIDIFPAKRWLSKSDGDKQISAELLPLAKDAVKPNI